jgi:hypothetical protein
MIVHTKRIKDISVKKSRKLGFRVPLRDAEKEKTSNNKFKGNFFTYEIRYYWIEQELKMFSRAQQT